MDGQSACAKPRIMSAGPLVPWGEAPIREAGREPPAGIIGGFATRLEPRCARDSGAAVGPAPDLTSPMSALEEIRSLIHKKYGVDPATLDPNASLRGAGIDSLTMVEILFAIEDHFGISVPERFNGIDTLAELAAAVEELQAEKKIAA